MIRAQLLYFYNFYPELYRNLLLIILRHIMCIVIVSMTQCKHIYFIEHNNMTSLDYNVIIRNNVLILCLLK